MSGVFCLADFAMVLDQTQKLPSEVKMRYFNVVLETSAVLVDLFSPPLCGGASDAK